MKKSKEQLKKELDVLKAHKKEVLEGVAGQACEVYSRIV